MKKKLLIQEIGKQKILLFGSNGMLGHKILQNLPLDFLIIGTIRKKNKKLNTYKLIKNINIKNFHKIEKLIKNINPTYVINCSGVIKQKLEKKKYLDLKVINYSFPLFLDKLSSKYQFKHIHFSTDCVFDGKKGSYKEKSKTNAKDEYGKYKALAEKKIKNNTLIIRTSIIGHEISGRKLSLLEWFLNTKKNVSGYYFAFFSGLTTLEISKILNKIIINDKFYKGLYNISSRKISKYNLLQKINKIYNLNKIIQKNKKFKIDRSLNSKKFVKKFKIYVSSWDKQILDMYKDYKKNKKIYSNEI